MGLTLKHMKICSKNGLNLRVFGGLATYILGAFLIIISLDCYNNEISTDNLLFKKSYDF